MQASELVDALQHLIQLYGDRRITHSAIGPLEYLNAMLLAVPLGYNLNLLHSGR